jgi:homoserine O-acetyltransferase
MHIQELVFGNNYKKIKIGNIVNISSSLTLECGQVVKDFPIAYQTYGNLNAEKSNAVLVCHALTGDQYAASENPVTKKNGWWNFVIGEDLAIDTKKFFVIVTNVIGGCMGSFGPKTTNPSDQNHEENYEKDQGKAGKAYGKEFPEITINDIIKAQKIFIENHFKINKLHAVIGGSFGGMQTLTWASLYPNFLKKAIALATSYRHTPQNIAFHEVGRQAIITDTDYCDGEYLEYQKFPSRGLALARMSANITYLSEELLQKKFGRKIQKDTKLYSDINQQKKEKFEIENYLHYQGINFTERFDPNSYICLTKAVDYFDLEKDNNNSLSLAFCNSKDVEFCLVSFSDDWLFPSSELEKLTANLLSIGAKVSYINIDSSNGHDSFLIKNKQMEDLICNFLEF